MTSIWGVVTIRNHALNLFLREVTPVNFILTQLIEEWLLPKVHLNIVEELFLLMGGEAIRQNSQGQVVHKIGELLGLLYRDGHKMLIRKSIIKGAILALKNEPGEMIGNEFSSTALSLISKSNSCRSNIHRMRQGFTFFFLRKCLGAQWLVYTMTLEHKR